jgi:hypothetical protein
MVRMGEEVLRPLRVQVTFAVRSPAGVPADWVQGNCRTCFLGLDSRLARDVQDRPACFRVRRQELPARTVTSMLAVSPASRLSGAARIRGAADGAARGAEVLLAEMLVGAAAGVASAGAGVAIPSSSPLAAVAATARNLRRVESVRWWDKGTSESMAVPAEGERRAGARLTDPTVPTSSVLRSHARMA